MLKGESEEWLKLFVFGVASAQHVPFFITLFIYQELVNKCMWTILYPPKCWNPNFRKCQLGERFKMSWNKQLRPRTNHTMQCVCWGHYEETDFSPFPCGGQLGNIKHTWAGRVHSEPKLIIHALCQQRVRQGDRVEVSNLKKEIPFSPLSLEGAHITSLAEIL